MANKDYGSDLASVNRLLKALQGLEEMVDAHMEKVQGLVDTAQDFSTQGNFLAENIQQRVLGVVNRCVFVLPRFHPAVESLVSPSHGFD